MPAPDALDLSRDEHGRVTVDEAGRRFTYDLAGRLASTTTTDGTTTEYGYDDLGLLSTERGPDGVTSYGYGQAGELLRRVDPDGGVTTYEHDERGRRTREEAADGSVTRYRWNLLGRLVAVDRTGADGAETNHRIEHDPYGRPQRVDGVPVLWDGGFGNGLFALGDERIVAGKGQVRVLTDPDGTWDRRVGDDPWGDDGGTGVRVGYRGALAVDGLLLLGDRAYDTHTRSFLSRDPLPPVTGRLAFAGPYVYAGNDPVNLVDPTGRRPLSDDEYNAWKEANTKGFIREAGEWVADNWETIAKVAIVAVGAVAMAALVASGVGLPLLIAGGALVGGLSAAGTSYIDGKRGWDLVGDAAIGAVFGGVAGPLARVIPTSTALERLPTGRHEPRRQRRRRIPVGLRQQRRPGHGPRHADGLGGRVLERHGRDRRRHRLRRVELPQHPRGHRDRRDQRRRRQHRQRGRRRHRRRRRARAGRRGARPARC